MSEVVKTYYCYCDDHCKYQTFTAEQIVGLLEYVIENNALPSDLIVDGNIDSSTQISAVNSIVEQNHNKSLKIWVGTQAEYDAYTGDKTNLFAIISDDTTKQEIIDAVNKNTNDIAKILDGTSPVSVKKNDGTMVQITEDTDKQFRIGEEIIYVKKPIWVGNQLCPKSTETTIQLNDITLQQQDTLEVEFVYSVTSNRPMRIMVQVARSGNSFTTPIFQVHLLGGQYLELKTYDYTSITCGGSISIGSDRDYDSGVRILSISKVQYKSNL
jgi:hypothetical protein